MYLPIEGVRSGARKRVVCLHSSVDAAAFIAFFLFLPPGVAITWTAGCFWVRPKSISLLFRTLK